MQAPGDPDEDRSGGFDQGGWQLAYFDDIFGEAMIGGLTDTGAFLFGRKTYENFARHWPNQRADDPVAGTFNNLPKYVVSTTLSEPLTWQNSSLIAGDVPGEVRRLKEAEGKDIQLVGSGELLQTLAKEGLVDEYRLLIHPLVLGNGKRAFREGSTQRLRLVDSKATTKGVLIATYVPADESATN
ncbi:MAG TPA: dihydrofolate reductase family protein [Candidatus Limnocylindrales bacterium]|nr:dihydrofolate reductase family protein [Candidatus Limnocylindrales bacterium]